MEQTVVVRSVSPDGTAQVVHVRESACSGDCHKCSGCGAAKQTMLLTAVNAIGAEPGDQVIIRSESAPVLKGAAVLYLLPLVLFFAGYLAGKLWLDRGGMGGCIGFALGIGLAVVYDRLVAGRQKPVYTITGFAGTGSREALEKGDSNLD